MEDPLASAGPLFVVAVTHDAGAGRTIYFGEPASGNPYVVARHRLGGSALPTEYGAAVDVGPGHSFPSLNQNLPGHLTPRQVLGEVLSDRNGQLYEKQGEQVRVLGPVVRGRRGELLEVVSRDHRLPSTRQEGTPVYKGNDEGNPRPNSFGSQAGQSEEVSLDSQKKPGYLPLFHEPGAKRIARFGEIKGLVLSQVAEPNRIRDEHRLSCYVQVFEITQAQSIEVLTSALLSETGFAGQLRPLTQLMAQKLQLSGILPPPSMPSTSERQTPGMLLPGDRVFRLRLAEDPTRDLLPHGQQRVENRMPRPVTQSLRQDPVPQACTAQGARTSIPDRFSKPWEFHFSREEVLYDIKCDRARPSMLSSVKQWMNGTGEITKWHALLAGKELDEQLWEVRPPSTNFPQREVLDWAQEALQRAGYDHSTMLPEWEIFWRRKGL